MSKRDTILSLVIMAVMFATILYISSMHYKTPEQTTTYTVQPGDTLWGIAEEMAPGYHTGNVVLKIKNINKVDSHIYPGQALEIPYAARIMEATAYTLHEGSGSGCTATGTVPEEGRTVAVDPEVIPYGTELEINGQPGYIAEDCGGAIKGDRIDIFMTDVSRALQWGRQQVEVEIVE